MAMIPTCGSIGFSFQLAAVQTKRVSKAKLLLSKAAQFTKSLTHILHAHCQIPQNAEDVRDMLLKD